MDEMIYCIVKDSKELCFFLGELEGKYSKHLSVIEDSFGSVRIVRSTEIERMHAEEAEAIDPVMYRILNEEYLDD